MKILRNSTALAVSMAAALGALPARAALGGTAAALPQEAAVLNGTVSGVTAARAEYSVQHLTLPGSTQVDEYVSAEGTVFALAWHGPRPPALSQLLGTYYAEYAAASTQPHSRSGHMALDTEHLTYRTGGHMRAYWGTAIVPGLLPSGVRVEDLR